jgi:dTDP-4-amino-4,6-dideoxygalactose transaminase
VGAAELLSIRKVFDTGILSEGRTCAELERNFARYIGSRYAVATSSCTSALQLGLIGLGIGPGDEVIVPDFTFPASANAVRSVGGTPVLADIDSSTFNLDPSKVEAKISPKTRAIMPVHLFGLATDMDPITAIAKSRGLKVIEDAACAVGTTYKGRMAGQLGDVACFSFHPRKIMTTGEGGMITTNDEKIANLVKRIKNHGAVKTNGRAKFLSTGYNYRLSDVNAAIGLTQLKRVHRLIRSRLAIARLYTRLLRSVSGIVPPQHRERDVHTFQSYVVSVRRDYGRDRDNLLEELKRRGIETQVGTYALHKQPAFEDLATDEDCPNSAMAYATSLSLPISSVMRPSDAERVVKSLRDLKR